MKQGYFVTGTDTDIGKTVVSTVLARGLSFNYWKPIQTGSIEGTDSEFVRQWLMAGQIFREIYTYPDPVSPHLACGLGENIEIQKCVSQFLNLSRPIIIEGAGGVLVPLNRKELMIDLIKLLDLPVIVVASTRLGTINHSLLTIEALKSRQIKILGVITNGTENLEVHRAVANYGQVKILGHIETCSQFSIEFFDQAFKALSLPKTFPARFYEH